MEKLLTGKKLLLRIVAALLVLLVVMFVCSLAGAEHISIRSLFSPPAAGSGGGPDYEIFVHVRLPRVVLACLVGAALACSGVVFQALLRNPLADPYILGISSGAGLGAIIAVASGFTWTLWGRSPIAVCAFVGALGTVWLVWFIGRLSAKSNVTAVLLAGVVVNAFFSALIMFLTSIVKSDQLFSIMFWLMGNMVEEEFLVLWVGGGCVAAGIGALYLISPQLNVVTFGQDQAATMGVDPRRNRTIAFAVAAAITSVAVSLSGLVGFVGLVVPHAVRLLFGPDHRQLVPLSAIIGGAFLVVADTFARTIVAPAQLPVGVVTAVAGGPFFLALLVRHARKTGWAGK